MNLIKAFTLILILISVSSFGQTKKWNSLQNENYSIKCPNDWELNESGIMGSSFIVFSPFSFKGDDFRENVNLIVQDISAYKLDLEKYVALSEKQILTMITNSKMISSEAVSNKDESFQKMVYTGTQGIYDLQFIQYYWVENNKAYILTLTCKQSSYSEYEKVGTQILNSFEIN